MYTVTFCEILKKTFSEEYKQKNLLVENSSRFYPKVLFFSERDRAENVFINRIMAGSRSFPALSHRNEERNNAVLLKSARLGRNFIQS